jgi:hypothetical protein
VGQLDSVLPHVPGRVAGELAALAAQGASGALEISGDPGGTSYLTEGYLTFAESAAVPDPGSRLVNSRRVLVDQWSRADQDSQPDGCAGDLLIDRGLIDPREWQTVLRSAALDALLSLAIQLSGDPAATGSSFVPEQAHPAGSAVRLDARSAWAYAWQEAGRLTGHAVLPGARLRLCGPGPAGPGVGGQALAVLGQIDGQATLRDLAWRNGLALYGVMDWVDRLIEDGVCTVAGSQGGDQAPPADLPAPRSASPAPRPASPALPAGLRHPDDRDGANLRWTPPDLNLLGRVLAGLRRMDLGADGLSLNPPAE